MDIQITKDADKMICQIYSAYLQRRSDGKTKSAAKDFSDIPSWPEDFAKEWQTADARETRAELKRAGLIRQFVVGGFELENAAIIYMENRFSNGISEVLGWLAKIKSAIPFA